MGDLLEEYQSGGQRKAWNRMTAAGTRLLEEPLWSDACAVAAETMKRARHNVELVIQRLDSLGYQFAAPRRAGVQVRGPSGRWEISSDEFLVWTPPQPADADVVAAVERACGRIPLALRAWYEIVGQVLLWGNHPLLASFGIRPSRYGDPLEVMSPRGWFRVFEYGNERHPTLPFSLPVCGDPHTKAGQSGSSYAVSLDQWSADPPLRGGPSSFTFLEYLRRSFRWGGFPGWESSENPPGKEIAYLSDGLLEI